ncbi:FG-GAP-like repeat-containing protein [Paracoccus sp. NGMCC 1.201697]|uniref:FG-GAP-like repeat-containing protein n=1 Tax=Paracoccus broussonetiae subsp. drimophilus TaxID=3373869 RepID=A0ABW7LR82_9RHOB
MAIFRTMTTNPTGTNPVSNAVADVNGDGNLDLLVANYISDNVSVLLGDGTGAFAQTGLMPATDAPRSVVTGDLDGDGDIDFLATNLAGNGVTIAMNDGTGGFVTSYTAVGTGPRGIAVGDLDGDGDLDFVTANYSSNNLSVMLNDGHGSFAAAQGSPLTTGGSRPVQMALGDFNGDGRLDLAVTNNSNNSIGILFNNGDGTFAAPITAATGAGPRGITVGDVDGDGRADLIAVNFSGNSVSVLRNDGTGGFAAPVNFATGNNPYDVKLGDLDGDGDLDMVVSNSGSSSISILFNDGAGNFTPASGLPLPVGISPGGLSLADFDGDGDLDIATSNFGSNTSIILLNTMATYSVTAASANEGTATGSGGYLEFTITRTATSEAESVSFSLGGSATAGSDYVAPAATVSFAVGQQSAIVRVAIVPDSQFEADESLTLTLTHADGEGRISATEGAATAIVVNDDVANRAPSGADHTLSLNEDGSRALVVSDFGFSDPDGHALSAVRITGLPGSGQLTLDGVAVTAGQMVAVADIAAGDLVFRPAANGNGAPYASLTFQVQDNGGTAGGGVDLDPTPNRLTFNVAAVNDAPVLIGDLHATVREGGRYVLTAADIGFSDPDDSGAGVVFRVSAPVHGALLVNGAAAASFTAADIAAGRVSFLHDGSESNSASFRVLVEDGNEDGSVPIARSFGFNVTPVNDAPVLHVSPLVGSLAEDASTAAGIRVATLSVTDPDGGPNHLSLTGANAGLFEIRNGGVWLRAGAALDFETNPALDVTVLLNDPTIGTGPEGRHALRIAVTDVVEGLTGTAGNDRLVGGSGNETLSGRGGNDVLLGGGGNDVLIGGAGVDTMRGGAGHDSFVFTSVQDSAPGYSGYINNGPLNPLSGTGHRDVILDFTHGQDKIDLSRIDANPALAGDQAFVWRGGGNFSATTADVVFRQFDVTGTDHDRTIVYGDLNHDGRADFQIELAGLVNLNRDDFIL